MKLQELAASPQTKQVAKVMESYFSQNVNFDKLSRAQARNMLTRVRALISEQRRNPAFHSSEKNPAYLQLVMMEQGLSSRLREAEVIAEASEVQQAQVVLASQDMVDQVQKMIEQTTAIQFKDLPALVDQIRNEVGYDQATQFNADATAALGSLVQNLQAAKGQLEGALGVVTGQAPMVPGQPAADVGAEPALPPAEEPEVDLDIEAGEEEEEPSDLETTLGRGKR